MPSTAVCYDLEQLLPYIRNDYPDLSVSEGSTFSWHAGRKQVSFTKSIGNTDAQTIWALFHELGHALLNHAAYTYDVQLLQLEVAAWAKARTIAARYHLQIEEEYVEDCLDSYRDWLHLRATCPACYGRALQASTHHYHCFNCQTEWSVSRSRFCRPYRLQKT